MYNKNKYKGFITSTISWDDALKSSYYDIENNPLSKNIEENIKKTAFFFQNIKNLTNKQDGLYGDLSINSWYRCPELNKKVGGSETSGHIFGYAIDFRYKDNNKVKLKELWMKIQDSEIPIHELYLENKISTNSLWIHYSSNPLFKRKIKELYV